MSEGVDVRPEDLRRGAGWLRDDAGRLSACLGPAVSGTHAAASASGAGPLEGAAGELGARLSSVLLGVTRSVIECADALEAASTHYVTGDHEVAADLGRPPPVVLPGLEPPR
jgi:hypothetical protein